MDSERAWGTGEGAPSLALPGADGTVRSLQELRGRPVLVSFLSHAA